MRSHSLLALMALSLIVAKPLASQSADSTGQDRSAAATAAGGLPQGWTARPDEGGNTSEIKFFVMEPGYHLTLGPATILYRRQDRVDGPFHVLAKFHQMKKPQHPEGYGLFIGGKNLEGAGQAYTYFLVRGDGKFNLKRREGEKLTQYSDGWQQSPAVKTADATGAATNLIEIDAKADPSKVSFKVNGTEVYSVPAQKMNIKGIIGIRANHFLDLHLEEFAIHE